MIPKLMACLWFLFLMQPLLGRNNEGIYLQVDREKEILFCSVL